MFDFSKVKEVIIDDLKPICIQNYLILTKINCLPKEVNLIIAHNRLQISDELILLNEDIKYSHKDCIFKLIRQSIIYGVDIFSQYDEHLKDLPSTRYWDTIQLTYHSKIRSALNRCVDILYFLDNNVFYKLLFNYNNHGFSYEDYEYWYNKNLDHLINTMAWKSDKKYIKLLKIIDLDQFIEFR